MAAQGRGCKPVKWEPPAMATPGLLRALGRVCVAEAVPCQLYCHEGQCWGGQAAGWKEGTSGGPWRSAAWPLGGGGCSVYCVVRANGSMAGCEGCWGHGNPSEGEKEGLGQGGFMVSFAAPNKWPTRGSCLQKGSPVGPFQAPSGPAVSSVTFAMLAVTSGKSSRWLVISTLGPREW